jgi:drug/metabolite transporter (DMT)-like permease
LPPSQWLSLASSIVIVHGRGASWTGAATGHLLVFAAVVAFAAGGATVQRLSRCGHPLAITWFVHIAGAAMITVHTVLVVPDTARAIGALTGWQWSLMLYSGVIATAGGAVAWSRGIAAIGVGHTAIYLSWVPLFGVGFGALLLGEQLNRWHAVGLAAVLVGTVLVTRTSRQSPPVELRAI